MKLRRITAYVLTAALAMCSFVTAGAQEVDTVSGDYRYVDLGNNEIKVTSYTGNARVLSLPEQIDGKTVAEVALRYEELVSLSLPDTVKIIWNTPRELREIKLSANLECIGEEAFYESDIESVTLPDSVTNIGERAFFCCEKLKSVHLGKGAKTLGALMFTDCEMLSNVTVDEQNPYYIARNNVILTKDGKTLVNAAAVRQDTYTVPSGVEAIGSYAFSTAVWSDKKIRKVILSETVKTIESYAFYESRGLNEVVLPDSLTRIKPYAFYNAGIHEIYIPKKVKRIERGTFMGSHLKYIKFGKQVKRIDAYAFNRSSLTSIKIPKNTEIGTEAFKGRKFIIFGTKDSDAQAYAELNGMKFKSYKSYKSIAKAKVSGIKNRKYNGDYLFQSFSVKLNGKRLVKLKDYTIEYKNNQKRGTATVKIFGNRDYYGVITKRFIIK